MGRRDFSLLPYSQAEIERLETEPDEWYALIRRAWIATQVGRDAVAGLTRALGIRPADYLALTTRAEAQ